MTETTETDAGPSGYAAARLRLLQEGARTGPPRRSALARLTDEWLAGLLAPAVPDGKPTGVSLVAVGGYGRGELSPRSDLDLLLLHDGSADPREIAALADRVWYPVWDLGLALDHSVRTPAQAREIAAEDLKVQLGLLDARHVAGDPALTAGLRSALLEQWRAQASRRLPELREMGQERARRQGELSYLLEPDLKEARGGLRDATALRAVAASWLADAPREGLEEARNVLLDARDALHLATGRATDRLVLQDQDQVAAYLGLLDADALLRQVYEAARSVSYASDVTWREVGRVLRARSPRPRLRGLLGSSVPKAGKVRRGGGSAAGVAERVPLADGVIEQDGEVLLARTARPDRDPVLPLRAAAVAAQAGLPLALPAVRRLAAGHQPLPVPWPAEAREQFVTLLGAGEATVPVWEALEAEHLITRLLPDWERVRCRPQRNAVHRWTVDRHLVETAVRASALTRRVGRPDLLLVAALLHDIGKGWPGDHSEVGETIARDMATRIGFDTADAEVLATLVRHHLLLIETATRRDLDDPATVQSVADVVGTQGTLELLHALTEADALATGPAAWSGWRDSLVTELVRRVAGALAGEPAVDPATASEPTVEQERLAIEAWRVRGPVLSLHTRREAVPAALEETDRVTVPGTAGPATAVPTGIERAADAVDGGTGGADGGETGREAGRGTGGADGGETGREAGGEAGSEAGGESGREASDAAGAGAGAGRAPAAGRGGTAAGGSVPPADDDGGDGDPVAGGPGPQAAPEPEPIGVELLIALPERPGVLPVVAGVLALHRLTVRTADLRALQLPPGVVDEDQSPGGPAAGRGRGTAHAGGSAPRQGSVLLLNWRVAAEYGSLPQPARLRADLVRALDGTLDITTRLAEREAAYRRPRRLGPQLPPPRVTVAPSASRLATVIEVRAQDAPGLLHRIGRALEDAAVTVRSAHVSTLGANAVDAFYVTGPDGGPLPAAAATELAGELERALATSPGQAPGPGR